MLFLLDSFHYIRVGYRAMVVIIKKGQNKKSIKVQLKKLQHGLDADKYCGVIRLKEDPLLIQQRLRDEW
jgi:hypothetical protein